MLQRIKEALKIGVEHPLHHLLPHPICHSVQCLMLVPPWPESVRKSKKVHFRKRVQYLDGGALDDLDFQHRYPERSLPPIRRLEIDTPDRYRTGGASSDPSGSLRQGG